MAAAAHRLRLSYLTDVRELAFPDIFWGRWQDKKVAFCCAYGAPLRQKLSTSSAEAALGFPKWLARAQNLLKARNHTVYRGAHVTWSSLFTETAVMMDAWHQAGYLSVDMETATTYAVARHFGRIRLLDQ